MHRVCLRAHKEMFSFFFVIKGALIQHSDCAWCEDDIKVSHHKYDRGVKGQGQIYLHLYYHS